MSDFVALRARLSQGDIVRVPTGGFVHAAHLADAALLDATGPVVVPGESPGIAVRLPRLVAGNAQLVLRARYTFAVVVSPDCAIDKEPPPMVLISPLLPKEATSADDWNGIRAGTHLGAFDLPGVAALRPAGEDEEVPFPVSFVDLSWTTAVHKDVAFPERVTALGSEHIERLRHAWLRYVALRELSTIGTLASVAGKTVTKVQTVQTSNKRHTAMLTFSDASVLVVYQEPKRKGDWVESVHVHNGAFLRGGSPGSEPPGIDARTGSRLIVRFENDDNRMWKVDCPELDVQPRELVAGVTTHVQVDCPDTPVEVRLRLLGTSSTLLLRVIDS